MNIGARGQIGDWSEKETGREERDEREQMSVVVHACMPASYGAQPVVPVCPAQSHVDMKHMDRHMEGK